MTKTLQNLAQKMNLEILRGCRGYRPHEKYSKAIEICRDCILDAADEGLIPYPKEEAVEKFARLHASEALNKIRDMALH